MKQPELVSRINELARKQREGTLSAPEKEEQARLRRLYIDSIKSQAKSQLDAAAAHKHSHNCQCGCNHKH